MSLRQSFEDGYLRSFKSFIAVFVSGQAILASVSLFYSMSLLEVARMECR